MGFTPSYNFSLRIKRDGKVLVGTEIEASGSVEDVAKAKKTIQRLLNEYTPKTLVSHSQEQSTETSDPIQTVPEKPEGVRGLIQVRCPECDNVFSTFLKEYQTEALCKCGHRIDLTVPLARFAYTCPYCEQTRWGKTNLEDPEITVRCKCGSDIDLCWNPKKREYQN